MAKVGVLTSGGDCPGLNAVIRAVVRRGERHWGDDLVGFHDGWAGVIEGRWQRLDVEAMRGYLARGGTMLGTSRVHPWLTDAGVGRARSELLTYGQYRSIDLSAMGHDRIIRGEPFLEKAII